MIERTNAVMIAEEDIEELVSEWQSVPAWIKAHVKASAPAHRYEGELTIEAGELVFQGRDIKESRNLIMSIPLDDIDEVSVGFSSLLPEDVDPAFGVGGPLPVTVRYQADGQAKTLYFSTMADGYTPHVQVDNIRWYEVLDNLLANQQSVRPQRRHFAAAW